MMVVAGILVETKKEKGNFQHIEPIKKTKVPLNNNHANACNWF